MKIVNDKLNPVVEILEDAQTEIRQVIKDAFFGKWTKAETSKRINRIIVNALKGIKIKQLRESANRSLWNFANAQRIIWQRITLTPEMVMFVGANIDSTNTSIIPHKIRPELDRIIAERSKGVPLQTYYKEVWEKKVKPTIDRLVKNVALDPDDYTGRNSLRNLAEMEVRYNDHLEQIENLKSSGVKLVVCSSHADCSDRCAEWQGRIYSLDGSSGEINGHKYVPLEMATDHYYTTKAGKTYKNGLLGFNCRHKIEEYKGYLLKIVSAEERKKEYEITKTQRALERAVRKAKVSALMFKDINKQGYEQYKLKAKNLYEKYKEFSRENERAYYPDRVAI